MEIDLDEVLDIEEDLERKVFIKVFIIDDLNLQSMRCYLCIFQKILMDSNSSQEIINVGFVKIHIFLDIFYLIFRNLWMTCWKKQRLCELLSQP